MDALFTGLVRRRRALAVSLLTIIAGLLLIGLVGQADRDATSTDQLPRGADSTRVVELSEKFPQGDDSSAIVLWTADEGSLSTDVLAQLQEQFTQVAADVAGKTGGDTGGDTGGAPADAGAGGQNPLTTLVPSKDGTAAFAVVPVAGAEATQVADTVTKLRTDLRADLPDGVSVQVTGPAAIRADLAAVFDGANFRLLAATATVVAILLVITYRSPVLWLVPLFVVGVADQVAATLATHTLSVFGVAWDESTVGILSVLVFGAGTDYALLLISRYRDELKVLDDRYDAMAHALTRTAEAVLASATTVVVGLLTLLLSLIPSTRGLGLACAVGIVVAAFAALVVLPCTLVLFGRWIFWPKVPHRGEARLVESRSFWRRVGDQVARRPAAFVVGVTGLLVVLALGLTQLETGLSEADQFLKKPEAIAAGERLAESFPAGSADPATVVTSADAGEVTAAVQGVDGVDTVRPSGTAGDLTKLDVVLAASPGSAEAKATVVAVRDALDGFDGTYVGGTEAADLDLKDASSRDRFLIIPLVLLLVVLALILLLRSLVAPLLLVASVVGTYLASLGLSWWLFTDVFGFDALDVGVPLLAFLFLVALGVDYNIFLVTRAAEEAREHGPREGMLRALTATGGVITSAGILLAAVFAVLGVLPLVVLAQLGVVICVGVLLDTLIVRTVLVPAIAVLLGDAFWWPRRVSPTESAA